MTSKPLRSPGKRAIESGGSNGGATPMVGLIGLGLMGRALGERLIENQCPVLGYDVAPPASTGFEHLGGDTAPDVVSVFKSCPLVILSLPTDVEVETVLTQAAGSLSAGQLVLDTTTGHPSYRVALADRLRRHQVDFLDATISGSSEQVRRGEALWMVGGTKEAFDRCYRLLQVVAGEVVHTGQCGTGAQMKLVTNLVLGLNRAALAEGLVLADAFGLDLSQALAVLRASMAYSRIMDSKGGKMVRRDFEPQARLSQHLKDVELMLKTASEAGRCLPLSEVHRALLERAEGLGLGGQDNSAILCAIESQSREKPAR